MFAGRDSETYDFSHWNPCLVSALIFSLCLFGSLNTFYDQFHRVSQLPIDRNEFTALKNLTLTTDHNRIFVNFTLDNVFSITKENFLRSLTVTQQSGIFRIVYTKEDFLDFVWPEKRGSFTLLSPIWGNLELEIRYLETPIFRKLVRADEIGNLYEGHSLGKDENWSVRLNDFCVNEELVVTFFHLNVVASVIEFGNGRTVAQNPKPRMQLGKWIEEEKRVCRKIEGNVHIFAEPPDNNPLNLLKGLFGPIAGFRGLGNDEMIVLWPHQSGNPMRRLLDRFGNIEILKPDECTCFEEATWHRETSGSVASFRDSFDRKPPERVITFLLAPGSTIRDVWGFADRFCKECAPVVLHADDDPETIIAEVLRSSTLVSQLVDYLGWALLLGNGATLAVMSEGPRTDPWLVEFIGLLDLMFTIVQVRTEGNVIQVV
jgi:hypothetical protein